MTRYFPLLGLLAALLLIGCQVGAPGASEEANAQPVRIMTYNIEDVRTGALRDPSTPRLQKAAAVIQHLRPDILLVNEIAYDRPGAPGYEAGDPVGQNARRFAEHFLTVAQADSLAPIRYDAFAAPVNTGLASGFDLNNDGDTVTAVPPQPPLPAEGAPPPQTAAGRAYGGDAFGFGTFPGQYGMALFVREDLEILRDEVRTFRLLEWSEMPDAQRPVTPETGAPWYSTEEWAAFRLSSKSHWDVPVALPGGAVLHVLASHPTPPAFDGPEERNVLRNRAEITFWADYLSGAGYIEDDSSRAGGLPEGASFVIAGDLNSDPNEGDSRAVRLLLRHPRVDSTAAPVAGPAERAAFSGLDPTDTARRGLRVDYVLPSENLRVTGSGLWRPTGADTTGVQTSDHFPVWIDVVVPEL